MGLLRPTTLPFARAVSVLLKHTPNTHPMPSNAIMGLRGRNLGAFALLATASLVQLLVQTVNAASKPCNSRACSTDRSLTHLQTSTERLLLCFILHPRRAHTRRRQQGSKILAQVWGKGKVQTVRLKQR